MKRYIKINPQTIVFATIAAIVFMLAANSLVFGQNNYKVRKQRYNLATI